MQCAKYQRFNAEVKALSFANKNLLEDTLVSLDNSFEDFEEEMREYELRLGFDVQDIDCEILNAKQDYDRETATESSFWLKLPLRENWVLQKTLSRLKHSTPRQVLSRIWRLIDHLPARVRCY